MTPPWSCHCTFNIFLHCFRLVALHVVMGGGPSLCQLLLRRSTHAMTYNGPSQSARGAIYANPANTIRATDCLLGPYCSSAGTRNQYHMKGDSSPFSPRVGGRELQEFGVWNWQLLANTGRSTATQSSHRCCNCNCQAMHTRKTVKLLNMQHAIKRICVAVRSR